MSMTQVKNSQLPRWAAAFPKIAALTACILMSASAVHAQFTWNGITNLNTTATYDGTGVDAGLNPLSIGNGSGAVIGQNTGNIGVLNVASGSLQWRSGNPGIGKDGNNAQGTVNVSSGASFTITNDGSFASVIGHAATGTVNVASSGVMNVIISGSSETCLSIGNRGGLGTINLNGGAFNVSLDPAQAVNTATNTRRGLYIGGYDNGNGNGRGVLNLNSGTFTYSAPITSWIGMNQVGNRNLIGTINVLNGSYVQSGTNDIQFGDTADNINFLPGGTGSVSITNWTSTEFLALATAGNLQINGVDVPNLSGFSVTVSGGMGTLKLADPTVSAPTISPTNTAYAGEIVTLSATASGTAPFTNQWQRNDNGAGFVNFGASTTNNPNIITQDTTGLLGTYSYQMIVSNSSGSITSAVAVLTVNPAQPPTLLTDVTNALSRYVGGTMTLSASFYGNKPMTNQWQVDTGSGFTNILGATSTSLTISNLQYANAGSYRLQASNLAGTSNSSPCVLTVLNPAGIQFTWSAPVPFNSLTPEQILNKNLGGAMGIVGAEMFGTTGPKVVTLTNGQVVTFKNDGTTATSTGGGPTTGAYPGAFTGLTTGNTNFDAVLTQFRFDQSPKTISLNNLTVGEQYAVQLFALDDRAGNTNRRCYFQDADDPALSVETSATYTMGTNAYIIGTFTASNATETIQQYLPDTYGNMNCLVVRALSYIPSNAPVVLASPQSKTVFTGRLVQFSVAADGFPAPTYQWQTNFVDVGNGGVFSGATNATLSISDVTGLDGVQFSVNVSNPLGTTPSGSALLTVLPVPPSSGAYATNSVLSQTPVVYWPLNETFDVSPGGMQAYDAVGTRDATYAPYAWNNYNGIVGPQAADGFPLFAANQGAFSPATNTPNTWVNLPNLNLDTNNTIAFTMWIYPDGPQANNTGLIFNRNTGQQSGFNLRGKNSQGYSELGYTWNNNEGATWGQPTGLYVPTNQWSFVALVVTSTNATWYLYNTNGGATYTFVHNHTQATWTGDSTLMWIGADGLPGARNFNGRMDEVAVFNHDLTMAQVFSMASQGPVLVPALQDKTVLGGDSTQFSVVASSLSAVTFSWKTNGVALSDGGVFSGTATGTLSISDVTGLNGVVFSVTASNAVAGATSSATLTVQAPALVGHWLDGALNLTDSSGFRSAGTHDGSMVGTAALPYYFTNDVPLGTTGSSYYLGGDSAVGIANTVTADGAYTNTFDDYISSRMTIAFWAKGFPGTWNPFIAKYGENNQGYQVRRQSSANATFTLRGTAGTDDPAGSINSNDGAWHHYAGTYDSATGIRRLYVDGDLSVEVTGDTGPVALALTSRLLLGGRDANGTLGNYFTGELYDVRVYNYALSQVQVQALPGVSYAPTPTNITYTVVSGSQLVLNWPAGQGWRLERQTNSAAIGLGTNWVQVATQPPYTNTMNVAPTVFYRLVYP